MAIARGAGTEILRSSTQGGIDSTGRNLIIGVQHHVYTVISCIFYTAAIQTAGNYLRMYIIGYDSFAGTTGQAPEIFRQDMTALSNYVWNTKFSFNGFEPTDFSGQMNAADDQDVIADQGSSTPQYLGCDTEHADDSFVCFCSFIDQNNA